MKFNAQKNLLKLKLLLLCTSSLRSIFRKQLDFRHKLDQPADFRHKLDQSAENIMILGTIRSICRKQNDFRHKLDKSLENSMILDIN